MKKRIYFLFAPLFLLVLGTASAQVSLAPTTVFIDQNGIGSLFITNPGNTPQEITIGFEFGYPGDDEKGNLKMIYGDSLKASELGFGDRLRAFPRTFILAPQQQQTVRLQARPDRSLAPGTYFTRVKVTSNPQTPNVEETTQEGVSTQVNFKFDQVIAAFQKVGETSTGLEIGNIKIEREGDVIRAIPDYVVSGNSPYLGSVVATLKNSKGEIIAEQQQTVAFYFSGKRAVEMKLTQEVLTDAYELVLTYETKRADIPSSDLVQAAPVSKTILIASK